MNKLIKLSFIPLVIISVLGLKYYQEIRLSKYEAMNPPEPFMHDADLFKFVLNGRFEMKNRVL